MFVCLSVYLSGCLAVCCLCDDDVDDLDLDELANDLPSDFLDSCMRMIKTDIAILDHQKVI